LAEAVAPYRVSIAPPRAPASLAGAAPAWLKIARANRNNLRDLSVEIPLGRLVALTGVSGSGKTTLAREILLPALQARLKSSGAPAKASDRLETDAENGTEEDAAERTGALIEGWESL